MSKKLEIKTGDRYGRLTILKEVEPHIQPNGRKERMVLCACDCGSEPVVVRLSSLRNGHTTSCGCLAKEKLKEIHEKKHKTNTYDLSGEYGIGYDCNGREFYFDLEDFDKIKDYCWLIDKYGYVVTGIKGVNRKTIKMHRLVMNAKKGVDIDHIYHCKTDNRKSQLREVTRSQNLMNRGTTKRNTSGVAGVYWNNKTSKWYSQITINRKRIHLGTYINMEDAIKSRKEAEEKYFGEYRYQENEMAN